MINEFMNLFKGSEKLHGMRTLSGRYENKKGPAIDVHYKAHLDGHVGLGICPIMGDNYCFFGVIDIDSHKDKKNPSPVDCELMSAKIESKGLPLILCKSKGDGGAHLYTFVDTAISAKRMRSKLFSWAAQLGVGSCSEIFPKQEKILGKDHMGSWINLPYFGNTRKAQIKEKTLTLEQFLKRAKEISKKKLKVSPIEEILEQAPPCLNYLYKAGIGKNNRNIAMFSFGVYFKRSNPNDWENELITTNIKICDPPLPNSEMQTLIKSLQKKDYLYKCKESPIKDFCDPNFCKTREFGIEDSGINGDLEFNIGGLTKILTRPPKWLLEINGEVMTLTTEQLFTYKTIRILCMEALNMVVPNMKNEEWLIQVNELMRTMVEIKAPEDTHMGAILIDALQDFVKAGLTVDDRDMVLYGPVSFLKGLKKHVMFRSSHFIDYCKRRKIELPRKQNDVWMILREVCEYKKVKVKGKTVQVWYTECIEDEKSTFEENLNI